MGCFLGYKKRFRDSCFIHFFKNCNMFYSIKNEIKYNTKPVFLKFTIKLDANFAI